MEQEYIVDDELKNVLGMRLDQANSNPNNAMN